MCHVYSPLDASRSEFRLLEVLARQDDTSVLQCKILTVSLHDEARPSFETISYCWGDPRASDPISIEGKVLMVPANTARAIHAVVLQSRSRMLWIDAVCINQADITEREQQVLLMRALFEQCSGNLVCLGTPDQMTARAFQNVREIAEEIDGLIGPQRALNELIQPDGIWVKAPDRLRTIIDLPALLELYGRPWFLRTWVVQEAVLSPSNSCICGSFIIDLKLILKVAVCLYQYHAHVIPRALYELPGLRNAALMWEHGFNLQQFRGVRSLFSLAFAHSCDLECSDPRDKVFGILGFTILQVQKRVPYLLKPNYSKSFREVHRDAARFAIQDMHDVYLLRMISHRSPSDLEANRPSWVPRLDRRKDGNSDPAWIRTGYRSDYGFQNSQDAWLGRDPECDPDLLVLKGRAVARIQNVYGPMAEDGDLEVWSIIFRLADKSPSYKRRFARTLTMERDHEGTQWDEGQLQDLFDRWRAYLGSGPGKTLRGLAGINSDTDDSMRDLMKFHQAILNATKHRSWAVTNRDQMALVPKVCTPGDIVAVMHAGDAPVALRPRDADEEFLMLGSCYVEGNMKGEVFERQKESGEADHTFRIR